MTCKTSQNCPAEYTCLEGYCQVRVCRSSADCPLESHCDLSNGQCATGCLEDSDCAYGDSCSSGSCQQKSCQSTELDCSAGEFCDTSTGTCFESAAPYCASCLSSADCGGGNNVCSYIAGDGPYCLVECSSDRPCPAGYDCIPLKRDGDIVSYNCATLCQYLESSPDDIELSAVTTHHAGSMEGRRGRMRNGGGESKADLSPVTTHPVGSMEGRRGRMRNGGGESKADLSPVATHPVGSTEGRRGGLPLRAPTGRQMK